MTYWTTRGRVKSREEEEKNRSIKFCGNDKLILFLLLFSKILTPICQPFTTSKHCIYPSLYYTTLHFTTWKDKPDNSEFSVKQFMDWSE